MREYVEEKCEALTEDQRKQLAVTMDDIVFLLPEDVSVVFNEHGEFQLCTMTPLCCQVSRQNMPKHSKHASAVFLKLFTHYSNDSSCKSDPGKSADTSDYEI